MRSLYRQIIVVIVPLIYSCATILNKPVQRISLATSENVKVLSVQKAIATDSSSTAKEYFVSRSKQPLAVTVMADTSVQQISLKPRNSFAFWFNIMENYGIGMLVDRNNPKRYSYPSTSYFSMKDNIVRISRYAPVEKGTVSFSFSLPFMVNGFAIKKPGGIYKSGGVYGAKAGLEYFYKRNNYLSLNAGAATDAFGEYFLRDSSSVAHGYALFTSFRNNKVIGSFDIGYGLHFSQLTWRKVFGDTAKRAIVIKNLGIGPALSTQFRIGKKFRMGVFYQPLLFDTKAMSFTNYQHYVSFDFLWRLPLHTPRRQM